MFKDINLYPMVFDIRVNWHGVDTSAPLVHCSGLCTSHGKLVSVLRSFYDLEC